MAVTPIRTAMPSFDHRAPAPVAPVVPAAQVPQGDKEHDRSAAPKHAHDAHHGHVPAHGPTPRPRRSASAKVNRSRRRRRAGAPVEDDEIELPEPEHHADGVASVGFQDEHPDGGNDQDEGERERSRHERLGWMRQQGAEQARTTATSSGSSPRAGAGTEQAVDAFVSATCRLAATARPGGGAAMAMQRAKLRLLQSAPDVARLDSGGLARVAEHLRERMPARSEPGSSSINTLLPLLILQMQLPRTPDQLDEAIARVQVSVRRAR